MRAYADWARTKVALAKQESVEVESDFHVVVERTANRRRKSMPTESRRLLFVDGRIRFGIFVRLRVSDRLDLVFDRAGFSMINVPQVAVM
jgi:hypothetical protein